MELHDWIIIGLLTVLLVLVVFSLVLSFKKKEVNNIEDNLKENTNQIVGNLKSEVTALSNSFVNMFTLFTSSQSEANKSFVQNVESQIKLANDGQSKANLEIEQKLENIRNSVEKSINTLKENTDKRLENVREQIEKSLTSIQLENSKKLEEMRQTVDEKLQSTLNARITESFKTVSDSLEKVTKGLGEMQTLATGVGDLKKVLSNVKTRGILGEIQLSNILEEILIAEQYETNVITKRGSNDRVEFAIKLPGDGNPVYLPIDSKFPIEDYSRLLDAYETADSKLVEKHQKDLAAKIKTFAKDISSKYIDVPNTTEFAIMFLPIEGLYAEVVRLGLVEDLQRTYKINIAGPTTMAALLNSIQMGFKSLAIQQRSSEVWETLAAVKTEFEKFSDVLKSAQTKLDQANNELHKLVGTRTRQIQRRLRDVSSFNDYETKVLIPVNQDLDDE
ncbi:MAG: DNA recombination protein RmuC [Bacilli bacterium]